MSIEAQLIPSNRARWARWVLIAFVALGFVLFRGKTNERVIVSFAVPPTLYGAGAPIPREALTSFTARALDADGRSIAVSDAGFPGGLESPVTPELVWTLPHGTFAVRVELRTDDGKKATLTGAMTVEDEGRMRVELR